MLGELNASHTGARYRPSSPDGDETASLGLFYDESWSGDGLRIAEVMPHNPLVTSDSRLAAGVILEKIDGVPIERNTNVYRLLNRKAGKYTLLSLFDPATGDRWEETVKPIDQDEEFELRYRRWVETRRERTEELSKGRIGYLHVESMSDPSYRVVMEDLLGKNANREAVIVDTRFNGGGDLVDDLTIVLSGVQYMDFVPPDGRSIGMEPSRRWTKPSIVIASEGNYSDAHCFPWAYQHLGIGDVLGMPVAGTCTFVWWERLQDPTLVFGIPNMAVTDPEGRPLENWQLEPDIRVPNDPDQVIAGRDQQLERAVQALLEALDAD
jgi:C-terminal processing protease CtpA/Prc